MLTYMKQIFTLVKMVQLSPLIDERMKRNEKKREEKIRPPDSILGRPWLYLGAALVIESVYEKGELYDLNKRKNLLHICQYVELVNYPFKMGPNPRTLDVSTMRSLIHFKPIF